MITQGRPVRIVVAVALADLGEATRALELARGIREDHPDGWNAEITFLSHGGGFASTIADAGFAIHDSQPRFAGISFREDLRSHEPEFIGSPELARDLIRGEITALSELKPDLVLHGFWPPASIACQMLAIPSICFLSLPMHPDTLLDRHFLRDIPDPVRPLTYLPRWLRRVLVKGIPRRTILAVPMFAQRNIRLGAQAAGWRGDPLSHIWDMLRADLTLVNDLPDFYADVRLPTGFRVVGPLFSPSDGGGELDPMITRLFDPSEPRPKVFCAMGSSPKKEQFLEAVTALTTGAAREWNSVIVAPPAICGLAEVRRRAGNAPHVHITDAFVPALRVNALADVTVSHGGQGTVQTAITSGTPIVGFGIQMEQQLNLDHIVDAGAGIRLPLHRWTAGAIQKAVARVIANPGYGESARSLRQRYVAHDGRRSAALAVWEWVTDR
jgi:UDP:flavonoid glycosyltransferase YjiC (YdhE family)